MFTLRILFMWLIFILPAAAQTRIAILDFELHDITSLPNTVQEKLRTASIKPLLEHALLSQGDYQIIHIPPQAQLQANASFGYLYRFNDLAVKLGERYVTDWIVVGQHSKPSFLFSYLLAHVIPVKPQAKSTDFAIELKGNHERVTQRGVDALARKIAAFVAE